MKRSPEFFSQRRQKVEAKLEAKRNKLLQDIRKARGNMPRKLLERRAGTIQKLAFKLDDAKWEEQDAHAKTQKK